MGLSDMFRACFGSTTSTQQGTRNKQAKAPTRAAVGHDAAASPCNRAGTKSTRRFSLQDHIQELQRSMKEEQDIGLSCYTRTMSHSSDMQRRRSRALPDHASRQASARASVDSQITIVATGFLQAQNSQQGRDARAEPAAWTEAAPPAVAAPLELAHADTAPTQGWDRTPNPKSHGKRLRSISSVDGITYPTVKLPHPASVGVLLEGDTPSDAARRLLTGVRSPRTSNEREREQRSGSPPATAAAAAFPPVPLQPTFLKRNSSDTAQRS